MYASWGRSPSITQFRQTRQVIAWDASTEDQAERLRAQPAGDERENLCRGVIKPLLVIYQAHQRPFLGHVGQHVQDGQTDQEPVRRRARAHAERSLQRVTLRQGEALEDIEHWPTQLVQRGERQFHLRLDTGRVRHPAAGRSPDQIVQERRLTHSWLAVHHQGTTLTCPYSLDEPVERVTFGASAD
jgi:hypothetical protein